MDYLIIIAALEDRYEYGKAARPKKFKRCLKRLKIPNSCFLSNKLVMSIDLSFWP